jgi:hypothetical protein
MTLAKQLSDRIEDRVPALKGRMEEAADLAALVAAKALPAQTAGFVVAAGFDGGAPDVATGIYRQGLSRVFAVVLFVPAPGDARARKAMPRIDELEELLLAAICGWIPDGALGEFNARRGRLVQVGFGGVLYQIDFTVQTQLRLIDV